MLIGKGTQGKDNKVVTTFKHARMKMRKYSNEFYRRSAQNAERMYGYMVNHRQTYQVC